MCSEFKFRAKKRLLLFSNIVIVITAFSRLDGYKFHCTLNYKVSHNNRDPSKQLEEKERTHNDPLLLGWPIIGAPLPAACTRTKPMASRTGNAGNHQLEPTLSSQTRQACQMSKAAATMTKTKMAARHCVYRWRPVA